jgi:hypothetical protein
LEGLICGSLFIPSAQVLTGLTCAVHRSGQCDPCWVSAQVNAAVCWFVSRLAVVSSLVLFGASGHEFLTWGFPARTGLTGVRLVCGKLQVLLG